MTKRESFLFKIFLFILFFVAGYFSFSFQFSKLNETKQNINKYTEAISHLKENTNNDNKEEIQIPIFQDKASVSEITDLILKNLKKYEIIPDKYQLNSSKIESVDFYFQCSPSQLVNYLSDISDIKYSYVLTNLEIKPENGLLNTFMRYKTENVHILKKFDIDNYNNIIHSLRSSPKPISIQKNEAIIEKEEKNESIIENGNPIYKSIGFIEESDNITYLFLKTINSGRIIKISPDSIISSDDSSYVLIIDDKYYKIDK